MNNRRNLLKALLAGSFIFPVGACVQGKLGMQQDTVLTVTLFNYYPRPIFDVYLNGTDIGVANAYGGGHGGTVGVKIPFRQQTLTWRLDGPKGMPQNGEKIKVQNHLSLNAEDIPKNTRYIGVHIYPDATAELNFSSGIPNPTKKGEEYYKEADKKGF